MRVMIPAEDYRDRMAMADRCNVRRFSGRADGMPDVEMVGQSRDDETVRRFHSAAV
jgi:hypothetical protein